MDNADNDNLTILWLHNCLPVNQTIVQRSKGSFPMTELILSDKFEYEDGRRLRGRTAEGSCLTVNRSIAHVVRHQSCNHNYDVANDRPLNSPQSFSCYTTRVQFLNAFIGDVFVEEADPPIDRIDFVSRDLKYLSKILPFSDEGPYQSGAVFDNEHVHISHWRSNRDGLLQESTPWDSVYGLTFEFKESTALTKARGNWVRSIVNLLKVLCGCDIIADNTTYYSNKWGARFTDFCTSEIERDIRYEAGVGKMPFLYCDLSQELQTVISSWMERPSTLRGASDLYSQVRFCELLSEIKFSFAMRVAEAAFADKLIAEKCKDVNLALIGSGEFDPASGALNGVKGFIKKLSSGYAYNFIQKIKELGERYDSIYRNNGQRIDWEACAVACRDYRNAESHGTIIGGLPRISYDQMFALERMAILHYELSVLDLFPLPAVRLDKAKQMLFERNQWNVSLKDYWSIKQ